MVAECAKSTLPAKSARCLVKIEDVVLAEAKRRIGLLQTNIQGRRHLELHALNSALLVLVSLATFSLGASSRLRV